MLDLFHRTSPEAAVASLMTGRLATRGGTPEVYASTRADAPLAGHGECVVWLRVPESEAGLYESADGEEYYRVPLDSEIVDVFILDADGTRRPFMPAGV